MTHKTPGQRHAVTLAQGMEHRFRRAVLYPLSYGGGGAESGTTLW